MKIIAAQIDLARQKESIGFIKSYADFLKKCGYNTLFVYLENAVKTPSTPFFDDAESYSMDEMRDIVDYVESIGLSAIPCFENLGHMEKFLKYDELKAHAETKSDGADGRGWKNANYPNGVNACVSDGKFRDFTDGYIREVAGLFKSEYIHMGLDEIFDFAVCPRCKKALKNTDKQTLFLGHILHCRELVKSLGKTMMMWDDFFEYYDVVDSLPRDIIMCCWSYGFTGDEIGGHWTGRVRRDALRRYDELGFKYLFCTWAPNGISSYRLETLTDYASKFNPLGAVMTMWEHSDRFYFAGYPQIAYAAALWTGKCRAGDMAAKTEIYASVLADGRAAEIISAMQFPTPSLGFSDIACVSECDYLARYMTRAQLAFAISELEKCVSAGCNDIVLDIYLGAKEALLSLDFQLVGKKYFDAHESKTSGVNVEVLRAELDSISACYAEILDIKRGLWKKYHGDIKSCNNAKRGLWKKYHGDIKSCNNALENKYAAAIRLCAGAKEKFTDDKRGILYFDAMMPEVLSTVRAEISVRYADGSEKVLHRGAIKPNTDYYDCGGMYTLRFITDDKRVDEVCVSAYGEGELFPVSVRHLYGGKKYAAARVVEKSGRVVGAKNILKADSSFAAMGVGDGRAHLDDLSLSKRRHTVRLKLDKAF